jgi:hypothetical protein
MERLSIAEPAKRRVPPTSKGILKKFGKPIPMRPFSKSAFILVDEIIDQIYKSGEMSAKAQIEWWKRVKSELQSF